MSSSVSPKIDENQVLSQRTIGQALCSCLLTLKTAKKPVSQDALNGDLVSWLQDY